MQRLLKSTILAAGLLVSCSVLLAAPWQVDNAYPECQVLDLSPTAVYDLSWGWIADADLEGAGATTIYEVDARWEFAYWRDFLDGDMALDLVTEIDFFSQSADVELPDQLLALNLKATWVRRSAAGHAWLVTFAPGIYSDIEEIGLNTIFVPTTVTHIWTWNPTVSALLGLQVRPDYEVPLVVLAGIVWSPAELIRVEALFPRGRVLIMFDPRWSAEIGAEWSSTTYRLKEKGPYDRDKLTIEQIEYWVSVWHQLTDRLRIGVSLGEVASREFEFDDRTEFFGRAFDVDDSFFLRVALGGPF